METFTEGAPVGILCPAMLDWRTLERQYVMAARNVGGSLGRVTGGGD